MIDDMERILSESDYYDYGRVLSYHAPWMFIIGARGLGKTYGAKKLVIGDWVKKRWQFIYLRRTAEEQKNKGHMVRGHRGAIPGTGVPCVRESGRMPLDG